MLANMRTSAWQSQGLTNPTICQHRRAFVRHTCRCIAGPAAEDTVSRRRAIATGISVYVASVSVGQPARAAALIQDGQIQRQFALLDVLAIFTSSNSLPAPVKFPRKPLSQRFAVLLMQSGYKAAETMRFMPMVNVSSAKYGSI